MPGLVRSAGGQFQLLEVTVGMVVILTHSGIGQRYVL